MSSRQFWQSFVFIPFFVFVLAGCTSLQLSSVSPPSTPLPQNTSGLGSLEISQAMTSGDPLSCMIIKNDENKQMTLSLHGGKVFLNGNALTPTGEDASIIYDNDYVYVWENGATEGLQSKLPSREDLKIALQHAIQSGIRIPDPSDPNSFSQLEAEGYSISCQSIPIADSVFVPPASSHFTDITATVQQTIDALKRESLTPQPEIVL